MISDQMSYYLKIHLIGQTYSKKINRIIFGFPVLSRLQGNFEEREGRWKRERERERERQRERERKS
jgi:hypothetical protein